MELLPVGETLEENKLFANDPDCQTSLPMTIEFFNSIGYTPPWIGYFARIDDKIVGGAAFKGGPKEGKVEIAYTTFPAYQRQGIGTEMCRLLVLIALQTNEAIKITARTLEQETYSTRILKKNGFTNVGTIWDDEDGRVLEWEYQHTALNNISRID